MDEEERKTLRFALGTGAVISGAILWAALTSPFNDGPGSPYWQSPIISFAWRHGFYTGVVAAVFAGCVVAFWRVSRRK